jgi:hypothetical protein
MSTPRTRRKYEGQVPGTTRCFQRIQTLLWIYRKSTTAHGCCKSWHRVVQFLGLTRLLTCADCRFSRASNPTNATEPTSVEFSFLGNTVVLVGIVVNGVEGQSLNFSVQLDDQEPSTPTYKASATASNEQDYAYQLFAQSGLTNKRHTVKVSLSLRPVAMIILMACYPRLRSQAGLATF